MSDTCTVIDIAGDYAIIRYDSTGAEGAGRRCHWRGSVYAGATEQAMSNTTFDHRLRLLEKCHRVRLD